MFPHLLPFIFQFEIVIEPLLCAREINTEYSLEGLMLKLKFQYSDHLIQRADSLEKTLMLGKTEAGGEGSNRG